MEQVIQFLEEYWGVSIAGGVTIGTIITFIVVQIKALLMNTQKNGEITTSLKLVDKVAERYNELEQRYLSLESKNAYLEQVNVATFKALSYIVVASKLPTEDKIALQAEFSKLTTVPAPQQTPIANAVSAIVEDNKVVIEDTVKAVVAGATDLLSKYVGVK